MRQLLVTNRCAEGLPRYKRRDLYERDPWPAKHLQRIRRALADACDSGDIELIASTSLVQELTGISPGNARAYVRIMKFVLELAGRRFLLPHNERVKAEVANGGGLLPDQKAFVLNAKRQELRMHIMGNAFAGEVATAVRGDADRYKVDSEERRSGIRKKLGDDWSVNTRQWWESALPQIDDWTLDYLRASKDIIALPDDETKWPRARQVPTAWNMHAYYMARIALNVGENRRIDGPSSILASKSRNT